MNIVKSLVLVLVLSCTAFAYAKGMDRKTFDRIIETVRQNSMYELSDDEIYRGALQGVMGVLEEKNTPAGKRSKQPDKFSWHARNVVLNPQQVENLEINTSGSLAGIGISLTYNPDKGVTRPVVIDVLEGGARDAGLKKDDQLLKIDGKPIDRFERFDDMVNAIRGPAGTTVRLGLLRGSEVLDYTVTRQLIKIPNVQSEVLSGEIAYLKLGYINKSTAHEINQDLQKYVNNGVTGLILDLRDNAGGMYDIGKEIIGLFVKKNDEIYHERKKINSKMTIIRADKDGIAADMRVVVLVGEHTSSIAEALTSIFKHRDHSVVMGSTTYGKASIENMFDAGYGYKALVTVGMLYDHDGVTWHGTGIKPDIEIPETKGTDNVLELAKDYIQRM